MTHIRISREYADGSGAEYAIEHRELEDGTSTLTIMAHGMEVSFDDDGAEWLGNAMTRLAEILLKDGLKRLQ